MTPKFTSSLLRGPTIRHGFFSRKGGCSTGIYASANCGPGSDDQPENVRNNRRAILTDLSPDAHSPNVHRLCGLYQTHSNRVHYLASPWDEDSLPRGDALVTRQKNIALGILTADCAPVLFADPSNGVIGAAHAGWKGALTGIVENTLQMMYQHGAELNQISAVVGPCISQGNYEVGPEFRKKFTDQTQAHRKYFINSPRQDHYLFDLKGFLRDRLETAGLKNMAILDHDTYNDEEHFFSYRRTTHRGEKDYGRQISTIMLL
ncbi:MAG: polyphenol oxidase [Alphaproteobacteria bacterium]|nr:MAG: polyphenol oxidase [Alphaproteobacteria bacterium]